MRFKDAQTNRTFKAATKEELVYELYATSWIGEKHGVELKDWLRLCSIRIDEGYGIQIAYLDPIDFVDDLILFNFIQEIN